MTNFKSDHNGYYTKIAVNQLKFIIANDFLESPSTICHYKTRFPCNLFLIILFVIQICSTGLLLVSVALTFQMVSAENQFVNQSTTVIRNVTLNSGNNNNNNNNNNNETDNEIDRDIFRLFLRRSRSLSEKQTLILTKDNIDSICRNDFVTKLKYLSQMKLKYCDIFNVSSVVYSVLLASPDIVKLTDNTTLPIFDDSSFFSSPFSSPHSSASIDDRFVKEIPALVLLMLENGSILTSNKSTRQSLYEHFSTVADCRRVLTTILERDEEIQQHVREFITTLRKNHCENYSDERTSSVIFCKDCEIAYKQWLCTHKFDLFISVILPNSMTATSDDDKTDRNSMSQSALIGVKSCPEWCSKVETECPYFTPIDGNGGEPAFLCDESHYHHNARYRLNDKSRCGVDMPWNYCCYSEALILETYSDNQFFSKINQDMSSESKPDSCAFQQKRCLHKLIQTVYRLTNSTLINNFVNVNKTDGSSHNNSSSSHAVSIFELSRYQLKLTICISSSFFLYFYTNFSIR